MFQTLFFLSVYLSVCLSIYLVTQWKIYSLILSSAPNLSMYLKTEKWEAGFAATWMQLEITMLSEVSQREKEQEFPSWLSG